MQGEYTEEELLLGGGDTEAMHLELLAEDLLFEQPLVRFDEMDDKIQRKKAQNRASQRAFRERKESKLKKLQDQLMQSELNRQSLVREIIELKKLNTEIYTENKYLLENKSETATHTSGSGFSFPTKDEFFKSIMRDQLGELLKERYPMDYSEPGVKLLSVPGTWEYLHKLSEKQEFDIIEVMRKLKCNHCCTEEGPSYPKFLIDEIISQAANSYT